MRDFVTFALMKQSVIHRLKIGDCFKRKHRNKKKTRELGPPDNSITLRSQGNTVQVRGDSGGAEKNTNVHNAMVRDEMGGIQSTRGEERFRVLREEN